jgi:uncharacterized Zn-finger protein
MHSTLYWDFVTAIIRIFETAEATKEIYGRRPESAAMRSLLAAEWTIAALKTNQSRRNEGHKGFPSPVSGAPSLPPSPPSAHPSQTDKVVTCKFCQKQYRGRYATGNLNRHIKWFHFKRDQKDEERRCPYCRKMFERPDNALKHSRYHCKKRRTL